jgi:signal transduction histidine kinase
VKWRLLAAFLGLTLVVLIAQDVPLAGYVRSVERDRLVAGLERDAFVIAGAAEDLLSDGVGADAALLQSTIEQYRAQDGAQVVVTDAAGLAVAVADDETRAGDDFSGRPEIAAALAGDPTSGERFSRTLDTDLVYVAVPVRSGADLVGAVRITYPASVIDDRADETLRGLFLVVLISLAGAGVAAVLLASTITGPIRRLRRTTEQVAEGALDARADEHDGPAEVRQLASAFNAMTARVEDLLGQQRAFAGDASHQLRTPLTAMRLQLERVTTLLDEDPERAHRSLEEASAEVERMQRLVDGLLVLARFDDREVATEVIDVGGVVAERIEIWSSLALERDVRVEATRGATTPGTTARSVPHGFEQALDNLLDNAISIVPVGTRIEVAVDREPSGRWIDVHVRDEGPGMSEDQLSHATDRFWRAPDAPHTGSGLGLAIVDHLLRAGGGSLHLANRPTGGLDARIRLPRA